MHLDRADAWGVRVGRHYHETRTSLEPSSSTNAVGNRNRSKRGNAGDTPTTTSSVGEPTQRDPPRGDAIAFVVGDWRIVGIDLIDQRSVVLVDCDEGDEAQSH